MSLLFDSSQVTIPYKLCTIEIALIFMLFIDGTSKT